MEENQDYRIPGLMTQKANYDYFKHITTLDSGAILVIATFLVKAFQNPNWPGLIVGAFICFVFSLLGSVMVMRWHVVWIAEEEFPEIRKKTSSKIKLIKLFSLITGIFGLALGMILLALFGVANMFKEVFIY